MNKRVKTAMAACPDCDWEVYLGPRPREGQRVSCPNCRAALEVIDLDPPELDWAFDGVDPDWDPDDDEEEWD